MHCDICDDIQPEDLKKNQDGLIEWLASEPKQARDHSRLVYYPILVTVKMLTDEVKRVRLEEKKSMIMIP